MVDFIRKFYIKIILLALIFAGFTTLSGQNLKKIEKDGKWGYSDSNNEIVIPCRYVEAMDFSNGYAFAKTSFGWGYINRVGTPIIPFDYQEIEIKQNGLIVVKKEDKYGCIDFKGKIIIPIIYDRIIEIKEDAGYEKDVLVMKVKFKNKYGIIDINNKPVVPIKSGNPNKKKLNYEHPKFLKNINLHKAKGEYEGKVENLLFTEKYVKLHSEISITGKPCPYIGDHSKYGLVDADFNWVVQPKYDYIYSFDGDFAAVKLNGKWGYIDEYGKIIGSIEYDDVRLATSEGIGMVSKNNKWGYIDRNGHLITNIDYDECLPFSEGRAIVSKFGLYGCIDNTGKIIIPIVYNSIGDYYSDMIWVKKNNKIAFLDKDGKNITGFIYDAVGNFTEYEIALVIQDGRKGMINKKGDIVVPIKYEAISIIKDDRMYVKKNGKYGLIDIHGKIIAPTIYDDLQLELTNGRSWVKLNGKYGWISRTGEELTKIKYNDLNDFIFEIKDVVPESVWEY